MNTTLHSSFGTSRIRINNDLEDFNGKEYLVEKYDYKNKVFVIKYVCVSLEEAMLYCN